MTEHLIQWTLLNNLAYLSKLLDFRIAKPIGQEISTDYGRIDFILADISNKHLVVELETNLDSRLKFDYCIGQTIQYKNVKFVSDTSYCILYSEDTNSKYKSLLRNFGFENNVIVKTYSTNDVKILYSETIKRLTLNVGLALPNPKNYTICFLRWLNKIMKTFVDNRKSTLSFNEVFKPFKNNKNSRTNFNCHLRIARDFELIEINSDYFVLTAYGKEFIENFNPFLFVADNASSVELSNEQKRLLLKILTNGNWEDKVHKINIYWFLRFIEVTDGKWLPKKHYFDRDKLEIAKGLFRVSYASRTMQEFLNWCCNYCIELGLVEKIKSTSEYDEIYLTPLGIEVNNIFSMDLQIKKSRMNLNFKFIE
ncbi:MAG: hypothetical protein A2315_06950 [Ignavibacteria bacterium RIFOXYB2_FULL_35_12]|nr:MAG: hypothetical protein A2058_08135 [Ignavibacteria bacterium GWA2_36_19]OGU62718.1 MAG: hypothetical protein A2X60_04925 [Ignavibacteria bacterium GWF2_35_20]OGU77967.1 MAG: hypothetical protein A2254_12020 [Ignavibacteria bacterium RIFOXYA2_FULL_35_9]OGU85689.1 MAG: hypothetical protein A3K31_05310 [Ignavibacteria bacterium RIFOXYA12_FULL_35_25]OGU89491.1 MAG: hypothetical protein A2492_10860 [Ignavibacteria bacterium RIFOXYC12_FULL_35_11]OGU98546.1 MAG: hypothetical protein A2455_02310